MHVIIPATAIELRGVPRGNLQPVYDSVTLTCSMLCLIISIYYLLYLSYYYCIVIG